MKPLFVSTRALEIYVGTDGQRFTDLIRSWANVYMRRNGASRFSINGVAWRPDGGVDGIVDDFAFHDPLNWFAPQTVMQFKAGSTTASTAKTELLTEAKPGNIRIRDKIAEGFKVVWFVGRGLPDLEHDALDKALSAAVKKINKDAPAPLVIDANRLAYLLSLTPAIALSVSSNPGLFVTTDAALKQNPHDKLKVFVPGSHYEAIRKDVVEFFLDPSGVEPIKYVAGEPGIGKSRCILEAVESSDDLRGTVCYFYDPGRVADFFTLAKQENWRGCVVIDEYIGESRTTLEVSDKTVPSGMKLLLIGHAYETNHLSKEVSNPLYPLSEDEIKNALAATYTELPEFRIREAVQMSRQNIRLARLICDYFSKNPGALELDAKSLERIVTDELRRMPSGQDVLKRLALLPNLLSEETAEFCELVGYDERVFRQTCKQISASSALIQFNDYVAYIGSPAVAQLALIRFWNDEEELVKRVLGNPGKFSERFLVAINRLPECSEKEAMLHFFFLPTANLKLTDLLEAPKGPRFLNLLIADPDTYLPVLHRLVMEMRGHLDKVPYEGVHIGRRDFIWRVRDLAQFSEYFEHAEQIVYAFAREDIPSAYANVASSYWQSWFHAYFDYTAYPYDKRLDLLERRAAEGNNLDREMVLRAVSNPFPHTGDAIPSQRVGGRLAPPELNFIHHKQIQLATERIPEIVKILLRDGTPEFQTKVADTIIGTCFTWLELGAVEPYSAMVTDPLFPEDARQRLTANVRHYVDLAKDRTLEPDNHVKLMRKMHEQLLARIDEPDPFIVVLEIAGYNFWQGDKPGTEANKKLKRLVALCLKDQQFLLKTIDFLSNPAKNGGGSFGRLLGVKLNDQAIEYILELIRTAGFSQFTYSALVSAAKTKPKRKRRLLEFAKDRELEQPHVALSIYQMFGNDTYFEESARLLSTTTIPSRYFSGVFLGSSSDVSESLWRYVEAISQRAVGDDTDARKALASSVGEFARTEVDDDKAYALGLTVLEQTRPDSMRNSLTEWSDIALWVYKRYPSEVIAIAARHEQSEFSTATAALAEIAKSNPEAVLNALVPKLADPYHAPFLLSGSLGTVVQNLPIEIFDHWLQQQEPGVIETIAAHLPRPFMQNGKAIVPDLTRVFWNYCSPDMGESFKRALSNFGVRTFNTGVFWGHGIELFSERIEIGKQLSNDSNPGIRAWAENFMNQSERLLADAVRSSHLDDARRATSE
jgi:hypothetical protein